MAYPPGFLFQPSVSLALRPPGPPFSSGVILGPRTEELCRSSSGSAFAPYSSSAASPGFSSHLPYGGEPRAAATLSSFVSPPYDPPFDPPSGLSSLDYHPFGALGVGGPYPPYGDPGYRKNATRDATATLKAWLSEHRKNPYPTKGEKIMLAIITKMTLTQVSTWFANARRRLKKENKMTWTPRTRSEDEEDEDHVDLEEEEEQEAATRRLSDSSSSVSRGGGDSEPGFSDLDFKDSGADRTALGSMSGGPGSTSVGRPLGGTLGPLRESEQTSKDLLESCGATRGPDPPPKPKLWSLVELATSGAKSKGGSDASEGGGAVPAPSLPRHLYYTSAFIPGFSSYAPVRPLSDGAPVRPLSGLQHRMLLQGEAAAARDCRLPGPSEPHELQRGAANV